MNHQKNNGGFSLHSVLVGTIVLGILTTIATVNLWPTVTKTKENVLASYFKEQQDFILRDVLMGQSVIEEVNSVGDPKSYDYLGDLISSGYVSALPLDVFERPDDLTWEIRGVKQGGPVKSYYIFIESTYVADQELIDAAILNSGF